MLQVCSHGVTGNTLGMSMSNNIVTYHSYDGQILLLENEKFFELKSKDYRDGIKRKKKQDRDGV